MQYTPPLDFYTLQDASAIYFIAFSNTTAPFFILGTAQSCFLPWYRIYKRRNSQSVCREILLFLKKNCYKYRISVRLFFSHFMPYGINLNSYKAFLDCGSWPVEFDSLKSWFLCKVSVQYVFLSFHHSQV